MRLGTFACSQSRLAMSLVKAIGLPGFVSTRRKGAPRHFGIARALLLAALPLALVACDEAADIETTTAATEQAPKKPELPRIKWLDAKSAASPERWLASREAKADLDENDPAVAAIRTDLEAARAHFGESQRMIANRAVQLEEMLAGVGIEEHAPELIPLLSGAASEPRSREGFGSLCQYYFNLRKQGLDREGALAQLKQTSLFDADNRQAG